jgi:NAD(P)H-dependent FMN reductase
MGHDIRVALIYGSTRIGRFCDTVARWAAAQVDASQSFVLDAIDPGQNIQEPPLAAPAGLTCKERLHQADAFIVVTPEYNHGYPAPLKALIDSSGSVWQAKPVAFVSYGGISGGLRAVEQLRLVFAELDAVAIRDSVSFASAWEQFDSTGVLRNPERANRSMRTLLDRLKWWAVALQDARSTSPYQRAL